MSYLIAYKEITTRKEHKCFGCRRTFPRNTKMLRECVKDDIVFTAYLCPTCNYIANDLRAMEDFCEGDLHDTAIEIEFERELKEQK